VTILDAVILGVVEGVTEYLPVSSTGHLILTATLLGLRDGDQAAGGTGDLRAVNEAIKSFEIVIQGGAILAVAGLYWSRFTEMIRATFVALARVPGRAAPLDERTLRSLRLLRNLVLSFLPAAIVGVALGPWIKQRLFYPGPVCAALILGGVLLIATGRWQRRRHAASQQALEGDGEGESDFPELTIRQALLVGFAQVLALWPGTSRSMVTILGGVFGGLSPRRAAEYSFLLGLPTLGGATIYELLRAWRGAHGGDGESAARGIDGIRALIDANGGVVPVVVGVVVAMISAAIAIKWLVSWLQNHSLEVFGWWRIAVGLAFLGALAMGWIAR